MDERLRPVRRKVLAVLAIGILGCSPWIGWWTIIPLALVAVIFEVSDRLAKATSRPELVMFAAWVLTEIVIATCLILIGEVVLLCVLAIPTPTLASRFSDRGIVAGAGTAVCLTAATALAIDPGLAAAKPQLVLAPVAVIVATAWFMKDGVVMDGFDYRSRILIDSLTGLFNRLALDIHGDELEHHCHISGESAAVLIVDVDNFKAINDSVGHPRGDDVLRRVAALLRAELRASEKVFRSGGDEFVVLLPRADLTDAEVVANRVCSAVRHADWTGRPPVTVSCGAAAAAGSAVCLEALLLEADVALYGAKDRGRDQTARPPVSRDDIAAPEPA